MEITDLAILYLIESDHKDCIKILNSLRTADLTQTKITIYFFAEILKRFCLVSECEKCCVAWTCSTSEQECLHCEFLEIEDIMWCCQDLHTYCDNCYTPGDKSEDNTLYMTDIKNDSDHTEMKEVSAVNNTPDSLEFSSQNEVKDNLNSDTAESVIAKLAKNFRQTLQDFENMDIITQLAKLDKTNIIPQLVANTESQSDLHNYVQTNTLCVTFYHVFEGAQAGMNQCVPEEFTVNELWEKYSEYVSILDDPRNHKNFHDWMPFDLDMFRDEAKWKFLCYMGICAMSLKKLSIETETENGVIKTKILNRDTHGLRPITRKFLCNLSAKIVKTHVEMKLADNAICGAQTDQYPVACYTIDLSLFNDWRLDNVKRFWQSLYWIVSWNAKAKKTEMRITSFGISMLTKEANGGQTHSDYVNPFIAGIYF